MNTYLTADTIRALREGRGLTQRALAEAIGVTDKAVSKWESGRGLPDITLIEPLAGALGVSVAELLAGDVRTNANRAVPTLRGNGAFSAHPLEPPTLPLPSPSITRRSPKSFLKTDARAR